MASPLVLSASQLSDAMTCPERWNLARKWREPGRAWPLAWGTQYHHGTAMIDTYRFEQGTPEGVSVRMTDEQTLRVLRTSLGGREWPDGTAPDNTLTRGNLARALVWYSEDPVRHTPLVLENGRPALEVPFTFPLMPGVIVVGYLDGLVRIGSERFTLERKTTKSSLSSFYFERYKRDVQTLLYQAVATMLWPKLDITGVLLEACHRAVGFCEWGTKEFQHTPDNVAEFLDEARACASELMAYERAGHFPMRYPACTFCKFRSVCNMPPHVRPEKLAADFTPRRIPTDGAGLAKYWTSEVMGD